MKVLCTGDWHLDRSTAGYDRYADVTKAASETVDAACEQAVELYVFLGDLADPHSVRSHRAAAFALVMASSLAHNGIRSIWMTGNHDVIDDGSGGSTLLALRAGGYMVHDSPGVQPLGAGHLIVMPHPPLGKWYDPAAWVADCAPPGHQRVLVVGHLSLPGAQQGSESGDMARGRLHEWPVAEIKSRWPNAIIVGGHYHAQHSRDGIEFAGSLARLGFDEESNQPGYVIVEV